MLLRVVIRRQYYDLTSLFDARCPLSMVKIVNRGNYEMC